MKICIDTCVFIAVKNREEGHEHCEKILDAIDEGIIECVISTVVIAEVLIGLYENNELRSADMFIAHIIRKYEVVPFDERIAMYAAKFSVRCDMNIHDAIIAATAYVRKADFIISNDEDIKKMERFIEIEVLKPEALVRKLKKD